MSFSSNPSIPRILSSCRLPGLLASLMLWMSGNTFADVTLPSIFSEHAVIQKADKVPVWGHAAPNEKVTVTLDQAKATTTTGVDGKWSVELNLATEGQGPFTLIVEGANKLVVNDVVIGEVWVCSGQSNMCVGLDNAVGGKEEIEHCDNKFLRQFTPDRGIYSFTPVENLPGRWLVAAKDTGWAYTAVGYFYGKKLQNELKVPVGLIKTCWGGTPSEAWTSAEAMDSVPELRQGKEKSITDYLNFQDYLTQRKAYAEKYQRQARPLPSDLDPYVSPNASTDGWKKITLPNSFSDIDLPNSGAVWLRKKITLLDREVNQSSWSALGNFCDNVTLFWNGHKVGAKDIDGEDEGFEISKELTDQKYVTIAVRITCSGQEMGIHNGIFRFCAGNAQLKGEWLAKVEYEFPTLDDHARAVVPKLPSFPQYKVSNVATTLFNGMIHPFIPYRIAGAIWYQGEWNSPRAFQYRTALPLLIQDWRHHWGQGDFPFYICQLPGFNMMSQNPDESDWAELREAQFYTTQVVPNTGLAVLIDVGEAGNIHPRHKKEAGDRLALLALARTYGQKVVNEGPAFDSMVVEGEKIRLHFKHTDGGLVGKPLTATYIPNTAHMEVTLPLVRNSPQSELEGFAICGDDRKWSWADARIEGGDVTVWSAKVAKPVAVRYAWSTNPISNLYNGADLPAGTFRTDSFPYTTEKKHY